MFERYTETARRALFFARYEASQLGSVSIQTPHLLLGLAREHRGHTYEFLSTLPLEDIRRAVTARVPFLSRISTSVEIPFDAELKQVLHCAAAEADALQHSHIGTEHLLLGILRQEHSLTASTLAAHGLRLPDARRWAAELPAQRTGGQAAKPTVAAGTTIRADLDEITRLVEALGSAPQDSDASRHLVTRILRMLDALKSRFHQ